VPFAPVGDPATLHEDPQVIANDLLFEMDHPVAGRIRQPRPLGSFETTPLEVRRGAPGFGQHTAEIAREIGLDDDQITRLERDGILLDAPVPAATTNAS